jgi:putative transposase
MKLIRSTKCSLKFTTSAKLQQLQTVLEEYGRICNLFIDYFWENQTNQFQLLKNIVDIPKNKTWLSARLRKVAAREAIAMVSAMKERWKNELDKLVKPTHAGKSMHISCTIAELQEKYKTQEFDAWLHLHSIGNKIIFDLPIKYHKHFNKLNKLGTRLNSYIITKDTVQFCFEIITDKKKDGDIVIGIDSGINALASLSSGEQFGLDIKECIERIKRCEQNSKGQKKARRALKQRIDEVAQEVISLNVDCIVVEKLKNLNNKTKVKRRLTKNIRRSIGTWNWKYWLNRIEMACELNRVKFRTVSPYYTSQTCSKCGTINRANRLGEKFHCISCGHEENADLQAARNILNRFVTGIYGSGYKTC